MHTSRHFAQRMHHLHDMGHHASHAAGILFHKKVFWGVVALIAFVLLLGVIVALFGAEAWVMQPRVPSPLWPYGL